MTHLQQLVLVLATGFAAAWKPCPELSPALRFPCRCKLEPLGLNGALGAVAMDCDRVVFQGESPVLPVGAPIIAFSQRFSGQQALPSQAFATSNLPLRNLDYSHNSIRRLPDKAFAGIQETLTELHLNDNLLGDSLNPIFSTSEFHTLANLRVLDLSGNKIKAIEEGILKGCEKLQEFYLDRNSLTSVPSMSLNGPSALKFLSLRGNNIAQLRTEAFAAQSNLERIDLRYNRIGHIEGNAFSGLRNIKEIYLAGNRLSRMNSDVFLGASTLQKLDLSENFITNFPAVSLKEIENVRVLNLSANMITNLDSSHLAQLKGLQILDVSRNGITSIAPGTFRDLRTLKFLDISLNALRTIEDDALEGLDALQTLIIRDNNILLIPGSALGRLPRLSNLYLDFNRVAALSSDILGSIQPEDIRYMSLSRNVIRELPPASFQMFKNLIYLDLSGNSLIGISADIFVGLEGALQDLRLAQNKITSVGNVPLVLNHLLKLDLSENNIVDIPRNAFSGLPALVHLNLSGNPHLGPIPHSLLTPLKKLRTLDLSKAGLKVLPIELLANNPDLQIVNLQNNAIQEIQEGTFSNLRNITSIDLSNNNIMSIRPSSFVNVMSIQRLSLRGNQLSAFKGEIFNTGTSLEDLDISNNQIIYLFPSAFRIHPRLKNLDISSNKLKFFVSELIGNLQYLEFINLSGNMLKNIEELDFARLPRLRSLLIARNSIDTLSEMSFHNSTQLQIIDLSDNKLERIGDRTFEGLVRLEHLNLEGNNLSELPETIFERGKLQMLENINLARNNFEVAPLKSLQRQYFFVSSVNLSQNKLKHIPGDDSIMVNIKELDLSFNPLSEEAISNILSEPKTVRDLNLAGTGIREITSLETPFLQVLNLSLNHITSVNERVFSRATLLENLDLSGNKLQDMKTVSKIWPTLNSLQYLDLSNNSFETISHGDLDNLEMLKSLSIANLNQCSRIEKNAFKDLPNLSKLRAYNYPRLGYLDVQGILEALPGLETLDIEVKDAAVGSDQIQPSHHPRLKELGIRGYRLRSISSGTLAGLKAQDLNIKLRNTSLSSLPPALLFPVPRSSHLTLDITGSRIPVLSPQLLSALDDRRNSLALKGLDSNPVHCDCNARALRRWIPGTNMAGLKCKTPEYLQDRLLIEVGDDELTCDPRRLPTTTPKPTIAIMTSSTSPRPTMTSTTEPEIIWSLAPTKSMPKIKTKPPQMKQAPMNNDDTLIIGIVGGVVAFIAILIIIICIVRLRMSSTPYRGPVHMGMPPMPMGPGSVQMSFKGGHGPALYAVPPYAQSYATLPHKLPPPHSVVAQSHANLSQIRPAYSTMGRVPYAFQQQQPPPPSQQNQQPQSTSHNGQPYVIYDEKAYR
ncbi:protein artichoke [Phlebotomus papatasi]|uniref:protein artichoke n=1 Tax=Phlebotomus papatasi TaxID=29031 RepID=UPI0024838123|nr:protein artichoke [Phlebotomus papatasi]